MKESKMSKIKTQVQKFKENKYRIYSTNFMKNMIDSKEVCFAEWNQAKELHKKYISLFKRYKRETKRLQDKIDSYENPKIPEKIFAVVKSVTAGYLPDQEKMVNNGIKTGDTFEVEHIYVGRSSTNVLLKDFPKKRFNSVMFNFIDENENKIDIFKTKHKLISETLF